MDMQEIREELERRFAQPLPRYYRRHIVFWQDPAGEFREEVAHLDLPDVKVLVLTGSNQFYAKKLLTVDDPESHYLVYVPFSYPHYEDNWLLDIELASQPPFHADLLSTWMQELHIPASSDYHDRMAAYRRFFLAKDRRQRFGRLLQGHYTPSRFLLGLMAVSVGAPEATPAAILRQVLLAGYDRNANPCYAELVRYDLVKPFWSLAYQATGYDEGEQNNLERLLLRIFVLATDHSLNQRVFPDFEPGSVQQQTYCYDMLTEWQHSSREEDFYPIAHHAEQLLAALTQFENVKPDVLRTFDLFPCVDVAILRQVLRDVIDNVIEPEALRALVEARRTLSWYDRTEDFYHSLSSYAEILAFFHAHAMGFHAAQPRELWQAYTEDYYRMDAAYREFYTAFASILGTQEHPVLDDLVKQLAERVENLYSNGFLEKLGENWTQICARDLAERGCFSDIPQQEDFYTAKVQGQKNRVFVIISDALRYEVAATLAGELRQAMPSEVNISGCQGIFPTKTNFGMAALLPHHSLSLHVGANGYSVLADGQSTESGARQAVLQSAHAKSIALKARQIIDGKRAERKALVQGQDIVYIYHDTIDAASHTDDSKVFPACREAIEEIKNIVRILVNDLGGTNILITADHGFLYTQRPLKEDSKVARGVRADQELDVGRRHLLAKKGAQPEYLLPVRFLKGQTDYTGFAPRDSIRLKIKGAGMNYVHGGISLQEMVVPVIEFHHVRASSARFQRDSDRYRMQPVEVHLLSAARKISNMAFSLNFYQSKAVGSGWQPALYDICLVDAQGSDVSDTQRIIADKTSLDNTERTYTCTFHLKDGEYHSSEDYYLVIRNAETQEVIQREPMQVTIVYEHNEIDFFSNVDFVC